MKFSNKLSLTIFTTGLIILIIVSFVIYKFTSNSIIKTQIKYTNSIVDESSDSISRLLYEKVKIAQTLANTPIIKKVLETSNSSYANLSDEKRKESIKLLNERWISTKNPIDNFILKFTDNKVSHLLKNQQATLKDEYGEIFLTNKFGALVASTSKLTTFAHGHKYWWLGSYNNGSGAVFFDDRGYDDSVGGYVLGLVIPVRKGSKIIGILKCNLNIFSNISKLLSDEMDKLHGKFILIRSGGMIVFEEGFEPLSTRVSDDIFKQFKSNNKENFIANDSGNKYLIGFSEIESTKGKNGYGFGGTFESIDHKKGNTGESWYVLCYRQMSMIQEPIINSIKWVIMTGSAIVLLLVLVSFLFGRKIAKPLAMLGTATEKIGKGDFNYQIPLSQKDEFGSLAYSFNSMASRLQQSTTSVTLLENEIAERKQAEEEREKLIKELQEASKNIKTLSGLLPICAKCKKIRDDKGYWNNLEEYIQTHSDASFSHGMCSECSDELYGKEDWYIEIKNEERKKE
ncbi:HAMP domain-containing protein [Desulfobacula sp.]